MAELDLKAQPTACRGQQSQMGATPPAPILIRNATPAEIPVAFPAIIWRKRLETEERVALFCIAVSVSFYFVQLCLEKNK